ncbi:DUF4145 domain-containing protein [Paracoccus alkanivorans]|nr:DUF4145 domain-containing protein [Paracoccus alkanivorans]
MANQIPFDCPHCRQQNVAMDISGFSSESPTRFSLMIRCGLCHKASIVFAESTVSTSFDVIRSTSWPDLAGYISIFDSAPKKPAPRLIEALPSSVATAFTEAEANFSDGRFASAAMGYRRALERGLKYAHPEITGKLHAKIEKLEKEHAVPQALIKLMNGVRFLGNDGAHDEDDPPEDEVTAGRDFITLLLTYLFDLPERVRAATEKRIERRSG